MKTLIVEDELTSRLLLQKYLSSYGECHVAVNGREALEAFGLAKSAGVPYDLICMDIMMPEMDGQAALRRIRSLEEANGIRSTARAVKVIMTTVADDIKDVFAAFDGLCDAYLFKPIDVAKLRGHLKAFGFMA